MQECAKPTTPAPRAESATPIYIIELTPTNGNAEPVLSLRRVLRYALRVARLRAISVQERRP